jgi:hypothetical protein
MHTIMNSLRRRCDSAHRDRIGALRLGLLFVAAIACLGAAADRSSPRDGFDQVLSAHVTKGQVNYPGIAADARFKPFLDYLAETSPETLKARDERIAYLINAYNAFAIKGILDGSSPSTFFGRIGYFKTDEYRLGGQKIDLYNLERKVIIPQGESRIHFAINCASRSCPVLRSGIYRAEGLDNQLDAAARQFINDSSRNHFARSEKVAYLSKIFDWFGDEFAIRSGSVQKYVAQYVEDPELARALRAEEFQVEFLDYDWSLNGIPPKR